MINKLRQKLAELINDAAHKGLKRLEENSPLAKELKKVDVEVILKSDIEKICNNLSLLEMSRVMVLMVQLNSQQKKHGPMKADLKRMVQDLINKVERQAGKLQTPVVCREMLFNL